MIDYLDLHENLEDEDEDIGLQARTEENMRAHREYGKGGLMAV